MTDWLRVLGSYLWQIVIGFCVFVVVLGVSWESWVLVKRWRFRVSEKQQADITASRVGWWPDQQKKNDQSRVDRRS